MYKARIMDLKEFQGCRDEWNRLVLEMDAPSIFCSWEWISTWLETFGRGYKPAILSVEDSGVRKGFLPLASRDAALKKRCLEGKVLSYCASMELYPDHLDIICKKEDAKECLKAVFDFLALEYKDWDVFKVSLVSKRSELLAYVSGEEFLFQADVRRVSTAPFIDLSRGPDDYISSLESRLKNTIKRQSKKLYGQHGFEYRTCDPSRISEGIRTLFRLHELRAASKNIESSFTGERLLDFHDTFAKRISENGWLWLKFLEKGGEAISAFYGFSLGGNVFYYQIGIDPSWDKLSPGTVLMYEVINEAFEKGCREFDFLRGNEEYKSAWTKKNRELNSIAVYNKTLMAGFSKTVFHSKSLIKKNLKRLIK